MPAAVRTLEQLAIGLLMLIAGSIGASGQTPAIQQPPGGELGSTMTLEQLGVKAKQATEEAQAPIEVRPAAEPVPALKYRFHPSMRELKPGSAALHYGRALLMFKSLPLDLQRKVNASPDEPAPSPEEKQKLLAAAGPTFDELHELALSEDLEWDHRLRDVRGPQVWAYLLPDVQEGRSLARLLRLRIESQLDRKDFAGAVGSIGDGFRLAEFMANGETLVQQLVALAIKEMMGGTVQDAITRPECPNLYWALAGVPSHFDQMQRAIEFEVSSFESVFEMLGEAETKAGDEKYWQSRLQDLLASMRSLNQSGNDLSFSITVAAMTATPLAKTQLIAAGWNKEEVEAMPPTRALLINTRRELRIWSDQMEKSYLLPYAVSAQLSERAMDEFEREIGAKRYTSLAASIAAVLFPSTGHARTVVVRNQYWHNRLMVVEALRMHAATHQGQLPKHLGDLNPVPALLNPFNNQPFEYTAKQMDDGVSVQLSGDMPSRFAPFEKLNVIFKDATLAR